ncbi:MAG: CDP-glycerol glycerophosphotransferase family protein [Methanomassiliicoccales archaeon]
MNKPLAYLNTARKIIQKFTSVLFDLFLVLGSYLISKDAKTLVFTSHDGTKFVGNPKFLYYYFRHKYKVVWITCNRALCANLKRRGINAVHTFSPEGIRAVLKARWIIVDNFLNGAFATSCIACFGRFKILQTWHGAGYKVSGVLDPNARKTFFARLTTHLYIKSFDLVLATSPLNVEYLRKEFRGARIALTGYPRNDCLFNRNMSGIDLENILPREGIKRIIMYAPTFRENQMFNPFTNEFLNEMNQWLRNTRSILLIKKHPYDQALHLPSGYSNIIDISDKIDDIQELLIYVDVLITDYSSVATDYVLLDRPMIFYVFDYDDYKKNCRPLFLDIHEGLPGPFAYNQEDVLQLLRDLSWFNDSTYRKRYREFRDRFHYFVDGNSCKRVEELLFECKSP